MEPRCLFGIIGREDPEPDCATVPLDRPQRRLSRLWLCVLPGARYAIGTALAINMLVAATVGVTIPLALKTFRIDPAIASSVIITTFTDVCGFFSFLGLATLLIRFLR